MQYDALVSSGIKTIVCSTQHSDDVSTQMVRDRVEQIITDELSAVNL